MDLTPYKNCLAHKNGVYISNESLPYKPCCWFKTGIVANTAEEYKQQLNQLDVEYNCSHCIKQEAAGATWSHRQMFNNPREFVLGVCFDNICNLKCVTCSPTHTSQLIQEWETLDKFYGNFDKKYYTKLSKQAPSKLEFVKQTLASADFDVLRLEIFGGEPLINPTVFEFIDWIVEQPYAKDTTLSITTNATTYTEKIKTYIEKFKFVGIQLSIDGINETFEYLRYGTNFENSKQVINNYYNLLGQHSKFTLGFNYTLSWMNAMHFIEFYNWTATNYPLIHLHLTKLEGPDVYSVELMPMELKESIVKQAKESCTNVPSDQFTKLLKLFVESMLFSHSTPTFEKFRQAVASLNKIENVRANSLSAINNIESLINDSFRKSQTK